MSLLFAVYTVSFCRFGFFGVVGHSCGNTVVLCSVWLPLNYWQLQHLIIGFLYICFTLLRFFKKVYSFLDVLFCWFGCLSQVVRMIGSGCRFKSTSTPNHLHNLWQTTELQMRKIFELLYCLLISRCNLLMIFLSSRFLRLFYSTFEWYDARASWIYFCNVIF